MNRFIIAHAQRGDLSPAQERMLTNFATTLGREKFNQYRQRLGIFGPIPRLSKSQAWRLINAIVNDLEAQR